MGRKVLCLMLMILALAPCAQAETPQALPQCSTREEVEAWVDFGLEEADDGIPSAKEVEAGRVRHIAQDIAEDPTFVGWYWLGGEEGGPPGPDPANLWRGPAIQVLLRQHVYPGGIFDGAVLPGGGLHAGGHERADGYAQPGGAL